MSDLLLIVGILVPTVAAVWKVFHELYVKPRDFRIDTLRDDMARLQKQLEAIKPSERGAPSPASASIAPVLDRSVGHGPVTIGPSPATATIQSASLSPATSLAVCYEQWRDETKTKLQKQQFEEEWTGKTVRWEVIIESVSEASHGRIFCHVGAPSSERAFGPSASLVFSDKDKELLLSLKPGDRVIAEGTVKEFFLNPMLESVSLTPTSTR
jgi:hypothetical protein